MSESRVGGVGVRRSRSEADLLVLEFELSGLRRGVFCRAHGISTHTLDYYRRLRRSSPAGAPELVPVELVGASAVAVSAVSRLRVELSNGRRIVVEEGFSSSLLQSLVAALEP